MNFTSEQKDAIQSPAHRLAVKARAGSGKTTMLIGYAAQRPERRLTYIAFNRSIKEAAAKKFPTNVRCVTTHGLAYPQFGKQYSHKLGNPRAHQISQALNISFIMASYALDTVTSYLCSPDDAIGATHVPDKVANKVSVISSANHVWQMMQDVTNRQIQMPHDGYLKLYQLSRPRINTDVVLFDEAQDANPVTLAILNAQVCDIVMVGDPYQAIYGFRHAVDAFSSFQADDTKQLTSSFRFGPGVARLASLILERWKGETLPITGLGKHQTKFSVDTSKPHAQIARTNAGLFDAAVFVYERKQPYCFVGGVDGYKFDAVLNAYWLFANQVHLITDKFISAFTSFEQMKDYAESVDDLELKSLIKIVSNYGHSIPALVDGIKMNAIPAPTGNEVVFATAHKAKGLEFPAVLMLDDFPSLETKLDSKTGKWIPPDPEEINLLYVTVTRAEQHLHVCASLRDWLAEINQSSIITDGANISDGHAPRQSSLFA